jgi:uncharacterized UPF0146 family protein
MSKSSASCIQAAKQASKNIPSWFRAAKLASTSEEWIQKAKDENIPDDVIKKIKTFKLKYKLFFCRVMMNNEIPDLHQFELEAQAHEDKIKTVELGLPKPVDAYQSLTEILQAVDVQENKTRERLKSQEHDVFDPGGKMKMIRSFSLNQFPAMRVYVYDDVKKQHQLIDHPERFCIVGMRGHNPEQQLKNYGGEVFLFVRDGKQWAFMAPHSNSASGFTNMTNTPLSECERAICILAVYHEADKWKDKLSSYMRQCRSDGFLEAVAYLKVLPPKEKETIIADLMKNGDGSLALTLLVELQSNQTPIAETDALYELQEKAKEQIKDGNFDWEGALKPLVHGVLTKNGAAVAVQALQYAINDIRTRAIQVVKRADHLKKELQQKHFLDTTFSVWNKLKQTLADTHWRKEILTAASQAPFKDFSSLLETAIRRDVYMMHNYNIDTSLQTMVEDLEKAKPYVLANEENMQAPDVLKHVFETGNLHTIQATYERQMRGRNSYRQKPGGGNRWTQMEAHILDMLMYGSKLADVSRVLVPYLSAVENPQERLNLMAQTIKNKTPEPKEAKIMVQKLERVAGQKVSS